MNKYLQELIKLNQIKVENKICTKINLQQAPRVTNLYSANKIVEWAHAKTKITQM